MLLKIHYHYHKIIQGDYKLSFPTYALLLPYTIEHLLRREFMTFCIIM